MRRLQAKVCLRNTDSHISPRSRAIRAYRASRSSKTAASYTAACVDVGNATFDCGVNRCKMTLAFLQHTHRLLLTWKDFGQEGIDQLHARTFEISGVARHHRQVIDQGDRRDLFIQFVSGVWDPQPAPRLGRICFER